MADQPSTILSLPLVAHTRAIQFEIAAGTATPPSRNATPSLTALSAALRMDDFNIGGPRKIPDIERQNLRNLVGFHGGDKPRIVHLNASDRVSDNQLPPALNDLH
jgi:hypothetical protein